jgi:methyl-accepting chemotaxis protein PixJ
MTNFAHDHDQEAAIDALIQDNLNSGSGWGKQSIQAKITILAIALSTIPTLALGSAVYYVAANSAPQENTASDNSSQRKLGLILALGTPLVAVGSGAIAYAFANRLLRPLRHATKAVQEISQGNFTTRLVITGTDEIAQLGSQINQMTAQIHDLVQVQTKLAQKSEAIKNIALQLAATQDWSEILTVVVQGSYGALKAERVVYYQFDDQSAIAVAECLAPGYQAVKNSNLSPELVAAYQAQSALLQVEVINNRSQTNLTPAKQEYLQSLGVKSGLIAPVIIEDQLQGLLMVHQSESSLSWMPEEVEFLTQVASQLGFAITRLQLVAQQQLGEMREKSAKEAIQARALRWMTLLKVI